MAPLPAARDMAGGRDRGDLAAKQLVFLLPGKQGRRVGQERSWRRRQQRREVLAQAIFRPRGPGKRGRGFGAPHFAAQPGHVSQHAGKPKPGSERRVR